MLPETLVTAADNGWLPSSSRPTTNPVPATTTTDTPTKVNTAASLATSSRVRPTGRTSR